MVIIGAGLAGLIAAHAWPAATVVERQPAPRANHRALLRFRSLVVSQLTGIEFRKVRVRKGIWLETAYVPPDIRVANMYARKTLARLGPDRSIWNIDPVDRYVAPDSLYEQLVDSVGKRIDWGSVILPEQLQEPIISTAPLPEMLKVLEVPTPLNFHRAPITVERYHLRTGTGMYQTVYFPTERHTVYRASITDDLLIVEHAVMRADLQNSDFGGLDDVCRAMGLHSELDLEPMDALHEQKYGKIEPLADEGERRALIAQLTEQFNLYSLGRFATWRNILLDDIVHDCTVIKRLMRTDSYNRRLKAAEWK